MKLTQLYFWERSHCKLSYNNSCKIIQESMPYLETCLDLFLNEKFSVKIKIFTK